MADKQIKLTLVWGLHQYEVKTITNTTLYKPGQWLDIGQVEKLCTLPNWDILIADDQTMQQIFSTLLGAAVKDIPIPKI